MELFSFEKRRTPMLTTFRAAAHRAIANTTGMSIDELEDDPAQRVIRFTLLVFEPDAYTEQWGNVSYATLSDPSPERLNATIEALLIRLRDSEETVYKAGK